MHPIQSFTEPRVIENDPKFLKTLWLSRAWFLKIRTSRAFLLIFIELFGIFKYHLLKVGLL